MGKPEELSLHELAELVDLSPRTVRLYIEKDLLPGPEGRGRYARYDRTHLERLKAIRVLQELEGLTLDEIRRYLIGLEPEEIAALARRFDEELAWAGPLAALELPERAPPESAPPESAPPERAATVRLRPPSVRRALLERHTELGETRDTEEATGKAERAPPDDAAEPLVQAMRDEMPRGEARPRGRAPGALGRRRLPPSEPMTRIEITPDVDLVVRGVQDERRLRRLRQIAEVVRDMLLGRRR